MDEQVAKMIVDRLDRQESKIDQMASAITSLARVEERMANGASRMDALARSVEGIESRLHELEKMRWKVAGALVLAGVVSGSASALALQYLPHLIAYARATA